MTEQTNSVIREAEDVARRAQERMHRTRVGRRGFLTGATKAFGAAGALLLAGALLSKGAGPAVHALESATSPDYNPSEIYEGTVEVLKGVSVRKSPTIPSASEAPNTVGWDKIVKLNGVELNGAKGFKIQNPEIYEGYNPNMIKTISPWIMLVAEIKNTLGGSSNHIVYLNMGPETADFVKFDGSKPFLPIEKDQQGNSFAQGEQGQNIILDQIGLVTPLISEVR